MGWHDVRIHAMSAQEILFYNNLHDRPLHGGLGELLFDIDYIFRWVSVYEPKKRRLARKKQHFKFWVSPATLAFQNVWDLQISIKTGRGNDPVWDIFAIHRKEHNESVLHKPKAWFWSIGLQGGLIDFFATGYEQYIRKEPVLIQEQHFSFKERGGVSFLKQAAQTEGE